MTTRIRVKHSDPKMQAKADKISESLTGRSLSAEHCKNLSKALTGRVLPKDVCAKIGAANRGKKKVFTEEHKANIGRAAKGRTLSAEHAEKLKAGARKRKGGVLSPVHCEKLSNSKIRWWAGMSDKERSDWVRKTHKYPKRDAGVRRSGRGQKTKDTYIELLVEEQLKRYFIEYEKQKPFGRYKADFYLPEFNSIIECDGEHWHSSKPDKVHDFLRDEQLLDNGVVVMRVAGRDIVADARSCVLRVLHVLRSGDAERSKLLDQKIRLDDVMETIRKLHYVKSMSYGDSWNKRGHVGVFMNLARKWDRLENIAKQYNYNFKKILLSESVESYMDTVIDLATYCMLWVTSFAVEHPDVYNKWKASVEKIVASTDTVEKKA